MKKLMNKKMNLFGKEISAFALVMVAVVALGSAALVPYLSNAVSGSAVVASPFETKILGSGQSTPNYSGLENGPVIVDGVHGGETFEVTVGFNNLADVQMDVIEKFVISSVDPSGTGVIPFSCDDFASIGWYTCTDSIAGQCTAWDTIQYLNMASECVLVGDEIIIPYPNSYDAGEINVDKFELTLKENALGTYTFSAQVVPAPYVA